MIALASNRHPQGGCIGACRRLPVKLDRKTVPYDLACVRAISICAGNLTPRFSGGARKSAPCSPLTAFLRSVRRL